jgi:hypothetical protein
MRLVRIRRRVFGWLLLVGLAIALIGLVIANIESLLGDSVAEKLIRLVAGVFMIAEGFVLVLDWHGGRRLVGELILREDPGPQTLARRARSGALGWLSRPLLFVLGLVFVGFGILVLTRIA